MTLPSWRSPSIRIATLLLLTAAAWAPPPAAAQFTEYPSPSSGPNGITVAGNYPDGAILVITETSSNKLAGFAYDGTSLGEVTVPTAASQPWGIAYGPDSNIWFTELTGDQIGVVINGTITEYPIPTAGSHPWGIAAGVDGALWFTESGGNKIGRITVAGVVTEFSIPTTSSVPQGIVSGPDGALWFVEHDGNKIGRITTAGVITEFPISTAAAGPWMIARSTDGNFWFTEHSVGKIGRITPAGVVTEFPLASPTSGPYGIAPYVDGKLFFTEEASGQGGVIDNTGGFEEFPFPTASSGPRGIIVGQDGQVWFTEFQANQIGRGDPRRSPALAPAAMTLDIFGNLWFTEAADKIARVALDGGFDEFPTPTAGSLGGITLGAGGPIWFAETGASKLGRAFYDGSITEFPVPSPPAGVALGPDGNMWFTEPSANKIARISQTGGTVTEYVVPTAASGPTDIIEANGALWFTEVAADKFAKITTAGVITEYPLPATGCGLSDLVQSFNGLLWSACGSLASELRSIDPVGGGITSLTVLGNAKHVAVGFDRNIWYAGDSPFIGELRMVENDGNLYPLPDTGGSPSVKCLTAGVGQRMWYGMTGAGGGPWVGFQIFPKTSVGLVVDPAGNGVLEPGETVIVAPAWRNNDSTAAVQAKITLFTGPAGATYTVDDPNADYGVIANGTSSSCITSTGNCYQLTVSNPATRPEAHWDAHFMEDFTAGGFEQRNRQIHIGNSFADVPSSGGQYRFIETLFHFGVTAGCGNGNYCPVSNNTRAQMAVFLLVGANGAGYAPPPCTTPVFNDVPCSSGFAPWVDQLASLGVTAGCGNNNYCPNDPVTRAQMAVFLLRTAEGNAYSPPACVTPTFADVPCSSGFAKWVDELARRGITAGCGGGNFCPGNPVTRGQMAVFLTTTFGLTLYAP